MKIGDLVFCYLSTWRTSSFLGVITDIKGLSVQVYLPIGNAKCWFDSEGVEVLSESG